MISMRVVTLLSVFVLLSSISLSQQKYLLMETEAEEGSGLGPANVIQPLTKSYNRVLKMPTIQDEIAVKRGEVAPLININAGNKSISVGKNGSLIHIQAVRRKYQKDPGELARSKKDRVVRFLILGIFLNQRFVKITKYKLYLFT